MAATSFNESLQRVYDTVARHNPDQAFLNFGFADLEASPADSAPDLTTECRRLYQEVLAPFPKAERVFEVACGRGGGAGVLLEDNPSLTYLGLDLSSEHIAVCRRRFASTGLAARFAVANATQLPVRNGSFNVAFSLEAFHHFEDIDEFYRQVWKALGAGGWFLLAGLWRPNEDMTAQFEAAGFEVAERHDITPNVLASLTRTSDLREQLVASLGLPERFTPRLLSWAGVRGSGTYENLTAGVLQYLRFRLRRN